MVSYPSIRRLSHNRLCRVINLSDPHRWSLPAGQLSDTLAAHTRVGIAAESGK